MLKRSHEPEFLDLGPSYYTQDEYTDCLNQISRINKYMGGNRAGLKAFNKLDYSIDSILDIGCGSGEFAYLLANLYKDSQITAIDINSDAINYANKKYKASNLKFMATTSKDLQFESKSYDVVTTSLVCHHLSDLEIINFISQATKIARKAVIINDLHRHWLHYIGCSILIPIFFNNRLVRTDSLLSIKKSFIKSDWEKYLQQAGVENLNYSISWYFPFRWIVRIDV